MILKDCATCAVYDTEDTLLFKAKVRCEEDRITLYFDVEEDLDLSDTIEQTRVDFYDNRLGYVKSICDLVLKKNTDPYMLESIAADCTILQLVETVQRQKDLRVNVEADIEFVSMEHGRFHGIIHNISGGGLYITCGIPLKYGDEFEFRYTFIKREHEIRARVLRTVTVKDGCYGYGCQFINLKNVAEKDIRQFVYRQQLKKAW